MIEFREIATKYYIPLTDDEFKAIIRAELKSEFMLPWEETLGEVLRTIPGVSDVIYDKHHGQQISLAISSVDNSAFKREIIKSAIEFHIKKCKENLAKRPY